MSDKDKGDSPTNIHEQISNIAREFRKQISRRKSPHIEKLLGQIAPAGREGLFLSLLELEVSYRRSQGESPTSDEYLKRFPQFKSQVRRAFFEPSMDSIDSFGSSDGNEHTASLRSTSQDDDAFAPTYELSDANRLGDYELIRELGRGGMGIVYEARHLKSNNRVALKTLPTGGDGQLVNADKLHRFRKEFRRLSEINHPNLVGMQSLEVDAAKWFFTMDLIDGENFLSYVRPDDQIDEAKLRSGLKQLATGVMELHRRGIIHRDLKPSNVLVSPKGLVTILDFGLAAQLQRAGDLTQTKSGMFAGTPPYAAPEQMFGERTEASDWYAFGTMLFESLTGKRPFQDSDPMALLRKKQEQDPPQLADGLLRREPGIRLTSSVVGEALGVDEESRSSDSTRDSQGSTGSVVGDDAEPSDLEEEDIVLIGREKQLAQLEEIKQEFLETRQPQVVWVTGLSGEGKSSLVDAFLRPIRQGDDLLVLSGRCYDRESLPYKTIDSQVDALIHYLRGTPDSVLEELLPDDVERLAQLFPMFQRIEAIERRCRRTTSDLPQRQLRNLAFSALGDLLMSISRATPVVMFIDDLQWGDSDSAVELRRLLTRAKSPSIFLIGCFRSDEATNSPFLREWQECLRGSAEIDCRRIQVAPLKEEECKDFIRTRYGNDIELDDFQVKELFASTKGNPYFLEQLSEGFSAITGNFRPKPIADVIQSRLDRCSPEASRLLELIAIAGKAVLIDEVATLGQLDASTMADLTRMRSERLVRLQGTPSDQQVDVYHDKIRESVLDSMSDAQRKTLHLGYAEHLETELELFVSEQAAVSRPEPADRVFDLAHHFHEAGDPRGFDYQLAAAKTALDAFAMDQAIECLRNAKATMPVDVDLPQRFRIEYLKGIALSGKQKLSQSIECLQRALEFGGTRIERAHCQYLTGESYWKQSRYDAGLKHYRACFRELGEKLPTTFSGGLVSGLWSVAKFHIAPSWASIVVYRKSQEELAMLAKLYASFAWTCAHMYISAYLFVIARGCWLAKLGKDDLAITEAYSSYANGLAFGGAKPLARRVLKKALRRANLLADLQSSGCFETNLGMCYYSFGDLDKAEDSLHLGGARLSRAGNYQQMVGCHMLWHLWAIRGNSIEMLRHAVKEQEIADASNDQIMASYSFYGQAEAYAKQGFIDRAQELADKSLSTMHRLDATFLCISRMQKARVEIQAGNYSAARELSGLAIKDIPKLRFYEITAHAFAVFAEATLGYEWTQFGPSVRRKDRRRAKLSIVASRLVGRIFPNCAPHGFRASGRFSSAAGKTRRASRYFDKAIVAAKKIGAKYELARSLVDKSMLDYPESSNDRKRGLTLLESLGCVLPDAEVEYLDFDREAHHARAAEARAKYAEEHGIPEFDLAAWEAEQGPIGNVEHGNDQK